jgi:tetratricopeptide (TPR) repeat protein
MIGGGNEMNESDYTQPQFEDGDESDSQADEGDGRGLLRGAIRIAALAAVLILAGGVLAAIFGVSMPLGVWASQPGIAPARAGEALIVIADFDDHSGGAYQGVDPAQYLYENLAEQTRADGLPVRVERLHRMVDEAGARSAGQASNATLVLWGEYDAVAIVPHLERTKTLSAFRSMEVGRHLTVLDPERIELGAITDQPGQAAYVALLTLGLERYSRQDFKQSLAYLDQALAAAPQPVEATTSLSLAHFLRGNIHVASTAEYDAALADYTRALALNPDYYEAYTNRGHTYYVMAEYDFALADYLHALSLEPNAAEVYYNLGIAEHALQDYSAALAAYAAALDLDPQYVAAYNARGDTYYDMSLYRMALADYSQALKLNPKDAEILNSRGVTYAMMGDNEAALADFTAVVKLDPKSDKAYYNRGSVHYAERDYQAALADYNRALELLPNDAYTYNNRGNTYLALGKYDAAVADLTRALELDPELIQAYYYRGSAYRAMGRVDEARADLEHFLSLTDNPEWRAIAERWLQELKGN